MRKLLIIKAMFIFGLGFAGPVFAGEVMKWVDENGVVHFGNSQFAPSGQGENVEILPTNGADVPQAVPDTQTRGGGSITVLKRNLVENPRGFRGHLNRPTRGNNGRRYGVR